MIAIIKFDNKKIQDLISRLDAATGELRNVAYELDMAIKFQLDVVGGADSQDEE